MLQNISNTRHLGSMLFQAHTNLVVLNQLSNNILVTIPWAGIAVVGTIFTNKMTCLRIKTTMCMHLPLPHMIPVI